MDERERLEAELTAVQEQLERDTDRLEKSLERMIEHVRVSDHDGVKSEFEFRSIVTRSVDAARTEETRLHRRLEALTVEQLTRDGISVAAATTKATWAMFWVALFAMVASTTATLVAAYIASKN